MTTFDPLEQTPSATLEGSTTPLAPIAPKPPESFLDSVTAVVPFTHEDGVGIRKRVGEKRYQLWLDTRAREAMVAAAVKQSNAELSAKQAAPRPPLPPIKVVLEITGCMPVTNRFNTLEDARAYFTFIIRAQKPGLWARFVGFFSALFNRKEQA